MPAQVISGAALGWDTALALAGFSLQIPVILAIPFDEQEERWPLASRKRYKKMLERSDEVHFINDAPYEPEKIQTRNEWMVNHADLILALRDGRKSGDTWNWLAYAQFRLKPVKNLWGEWVRMRSKAFAKLYPNPMDDNYIQQEELGLSGFLVDGRDIDHFREIG